MNLSEPFIRRPVGTALLSIGLLRRSASSPIISCPSPPIPRVDFPVFPSSASLPGADPETVASSLATPLERRLGQIAGVTEMTSASTLGGTSISVQFDLNRKVDSAARDVQAAINAAASELPLNLPNPPTYRKVNPADAPIMVLAMTSKAHTRAALFEFADEIIGQRLSQVEGVSQVSIGGGEKSAVRVQVNPAALASHRPQPRRRPRLSSASEREPAERQRGRRERLVHDLQQRSAARSGRVQAAWSWPQRTARRSTSARLPMSIDGVENNRNAGSAGSHAWDGMQPAVLLVIFKQPDANVIETVERIRAVLPQIREMAAAERASCDVLSDRTNTIRASVNDVQFSLLLSIALVVMVIFLFLRRFWPTFIASITVPLALAGTFGVMYLLGFTLDNLSLMAVTISVGFVVDDAIVVIENVFRFIEKGRHAPASRDQGRAPDRLHGRLDEPLARRGLHSAALHGRAGRPAVSRVRGHAQRGHPRLRA